MLRLCNAVNFCNVGRERQLTLFPSQSDVHEKFRNLVIENKLPGIGQKLVVKEPIQDLRRIANRSTRTVLPTTITNYNTDLILTKGVDKYPSQNIEASSLIKSGSQTFAGCTPMWSVNACHPRTKFESMIDWSVPATDFVFHLPPLSPGSLTYQLARKDFRRCSLECGSRSCDGKKRKVFGKSNKCTCDALKARVRLAPYAPANDCVRRQKLTTGRNFLTPLLAGYEKKHVYAQDKELKVSKFQLSNRFKA